MKSRSIWIMTTTFNGHIMLRALVDQGIPVSGVIGLDKNLHRGSEYYDSSLFCREKNIEYVAVEDYELSSLHPILERTSIDLLLVLGWQRLIPESLIKSVKHTCIGVHGSDLGINRGRGRSPQNWSLIMGAPKFELSIFHIDVGVDSGEVIDSVEIPLTKDEDIVTLHNKVAYATVEMLLNYINTGARNKFNEKSLNDTIEYFPKRLPQDGMIDWQRDASKVVSFIRALSYPYPGAYSYHKESKIVFWNAFLLTISGRLKDVSAGKVLNYLPNIQISIKCKDHVLLSTNFEIHGPELIEEELDMMTSSSFEHQMKLIFERHDKKYPYFPIASRLRDLE